MSLPPFPDCLQLLGGGFEGGRKVLGFSAVCLPSLKFGYFLVKDRHLCGDLECICNVTISVVV